MRSIFKSGFFACLFLLPLIATGCQRLQQSDNAAANVANSESATANTDAKAAFEAGMKALDSGNIDEAIDFLGKAVEADPDFADAWFNLGIAYAIAEKRDAESGITSPTPIPGEPTPKPTKPNSQKAFEKAAAAYERIVEADPNNHQAFFNLGLARNKLNEDEAAAKALRQAVKLNPEDTEYQTELGAILIKLAQYRDAIGPLKKAIELDPENVKAQQLLEDAEAGRKRIDYVALPKNGKADQNTNTENPDLQPEANTATNTSPKGGSTPPADGKKAPTPNPVKTPSKPTGNPPAKQ